MVKNFISYIIGFVVVFLINGGKYGLFKNLLIATFWPLWLVFKLFGFALDALDIIIAVIEIFIELFL